MLNRFCRQPFIGYKPRASQFFSSVVALSIVASVCSAGWVKAQSGDLGAYSGTISVSGTRVDPKVSYSATIKISLPVTDRDDSSATSEFFSGEAPNATATISQWDVSHTEKSPDSDGKFSSWTCSLAAPSAIQMAPTGVLNVDLEAKTHTLSISLLSIEDLDLNCVHSRTGAYKKKEGVVLYVGTGTPGMQYQNQLPLSDPARLTAKYTLMPNDETKGDYGPIVQEWDLRLTH